MLHALQMLLCVCVNMLLARPFEDSMMRMTGGSLNSKVNGAFKKSVGTLHITLGSSASAMYEIISCLII